MAKLPDLNSMGARPIPTSRRSIASNPRAGAVGEALSGMGDAVAGIGGAMMEKEDRLAIAAARTSVMRADIEARQELENDPDYETWGERYSARMTEARAAASGSLRSRTDRTLFDADAEMDIARGSAALSSAATARRRDARLALGMDTLSGLQDVGQNSSDPAAREATIGQANAVIASMIDQGDIDAVRGGQMRRDWTQNYIVQRIETLRNAEDYDGAMALFENSRANLDPSTETRMFGLLTDANNNRETLVLAEEFVRGPARPAATDGTVPTVALAPHQASVASELQGAGMSQAVVAGFLGNFEVEGGYSGARGDGGTASGIAQWRHERRANFRSQFGKDPHEASAAEQAQFVVWEMNNPGAAGMTVAQRDQILAADTPEVAADLIDRFYERSSGQHRSERQQHAARLHGGGEAPQRHDLETIYASINERAAAENWTPEKTERVKAQSARLVERDEVLLRREEDDSYEAALARVETLGDNFTDPSQLGDAYYRASEAQQRTLRNISEANLRAQSAVTAAPANGDVVRSLHRMAIEAPGEFAGIDLRPYRAFMTPGEFDEVSTSQARAGVASGEWSPRAQIQTAITWGENFGGVEIADDEDKYRVYRFMESRANQFRGESAGRVPAETDYQRWFREATAETRITNRFMGIDALAPDSTTRAFDQLSTPYRAMIERQFRTAYGRDPTPEETQQWFDRMGEALR